MTTKLDFFIQAMKAECFRRRAWVFSAFSITREDKVEGEVYPYKIQRIDGKYAFHDPEKNLELTIIEDSDGTIPLINHKERIHLGYTHAINLPQGVKQSFETTYGNLFFNYVALIYPFKDKIPFQFGRISAGAIEDIIASRLTSDLKDGEAPADSNAIYVSEYLKFGEAMMYLSGFTQLWVPAGSAKTMTCHPDTPKVKAALLEKYKGQLHDPAIIAKIEAELVKFDKEQWLKGDPGAEGFLIKKKSTDVVRKKMFLMYGAEAGFDESVGANLITNSLQEGWDIDKFPDMLNVSRVGSFNRGAQTQLGGEAVKWLLRASSNMGIASDDCGTKLGIPITITENNAKMLLQRYLVVGEETVLLTDENISSFIGKTVIMRSPMFCKLDKTDYCAKCCGSKLSTHKTGLSMAVSDYGSSFLGMFMAAMHAKALQTAKMDVNNTFF